MFAIHLYIYKGDIRNIITMKTTILKSKEIGNLKHTLSKNTIKDVKNYSIKTSLIKGNNLLEANTLLGNECFDTLRKAENYFKRYLKWDQQKRKEAK